MKNINEWASKLSIEDINNLTDEEITEYATERPDHPGQFGFVLDPKHFNSLNHFASTTHALILRLQKIKKDEKVTKIELRKETVETPEGKNYYNDSASLKDNGDLNISSFDFGPKVDKLWGHDYEYDITIDKEWKDTLLLLLIQEQFKTASEFKKWIDQKNIPATTSLW
jgi:hypothetical protein